MEEVLFKANSSRSGTRQAALTSCGKTKREENEGRFESVGVIDSSLVLASASSVSSVDED